MARGVFDRRVLPAARRAACHVPLEFLRVVLTTGSGGSGGGGGGSGGGGGGSGGGGGGGAAAWAPGPWGWGAAEADEDEAALRLQVRGAAWYRRARTGRGGAHTVAWWPPRPSPVPALSPRRPMHSPPPPRPQEWRLRLTYLLLETLGALRIDDMFDVVVDYPDSTPAVEDLAACLANTVGGGRGRGE
jgi:hypothetical protein